MRCRLLACFLAVCCLAMGQNNRMSVEKLISFVQSSQKIITEEKTMTDKQLAEFLSKVKLTEKLEPVSYTHLQSAPRVAVWAGQFAGWSAPERPKALARPTAAPESSVT